MITKQIMSSRVGPNDIKIILIFLVNYKKCLLKFYYLHYSIEIYLVNVLNTCTLRLVSETWCVLYTYLSIGVRFLSIYQLFKWKKSGEQANNYVENTMKLQQPSAYIWPSMSLKKKYWISVHCITQPHKIYESICKDQILLFHQINCPLHKVHTGKYYLLLLKKVLFSE